MSKIQDMLDIPSDAIELLEVIGYLDVKDLTAAEVRELHSELVKANDKFSILESAPTIEQVLGWQRALFSVGEPEAIVKDMVNLTECNRDQEINVTLSDPAVVTEDQYDTTNRLRTGLETSRIRSFDQVDVDDHPVKPLERGASREVISVSKDLNKGLSPESRRFIRGVLHSNPRRVRLAAFLAICVTLSLTATLVMIPLLLLFEYYSGQSTIWYVVGIAATLLVSALFYLFWGIGVSCRICGQRLYAPKKCLKHRKAHRIPLLGYILPTALHTLLYNWIYCTYCGTAVRFKK